MGQNGPHDQLEKPPPLNAALAELKVIAKTK